MLIQFAPANITSHCNVDYAFKTTAIETIVLVKKGINCDIKVYQNFQNQIISNKDFPLLSGYVEYAAQKCPTPFLGSFDYTFKNSSTTYCDSKSVWDVCSNPSQMVVNYTLCSTRQFYSGKALI